MDRVHILLYSQVQALFIDVEICYAYTFLSTSQRRSFKYDERKHGRICVIYVDQRFIGIAVVAFLALHNC